MAFKNNETNIMFGQAYERKVKVSFIDYDIFEVLGEDLILETKRCFKIDQRLMLLSKYFIKKVLLNKIMFFRWFRKKFRKFVLIKEFI